MGATLDPAKTRASTRRRVLAKRDPFAPARRRMVKRLLDRGLLGDRVSEVMNRIPRHQLLPEALADRAYDDAALPIGEGQTISAPSIVALMSQALELRPGDRVLEIGTGSAYQTAILAGLCDHVTSIERVPRLAARARKALDQLGVTNAIVHLGDGSEGRPQAAPFDAILVTAGGPDVPPPLLDQLAPEGRLVGPFGPRDRQELLRLTRNAAAADWTRESLGACRFVALVGAHAWSRA